MKEKHNDYFNVNQQTWDLKVPIHVASEFYAVAEFMKGQTSLNPIEVEEMGSVKEKSILHLQCHFGLDTLSWSRMGAHCTGIDLSSKGIEKAIEIREELNVFAHFIKSNVYDVPANVNGKFDIVYTSYGVVGWLPDLDAWAQVISEKLKNGGFFYMIEFHPIVWMFDYDTGNPVLKHGYNHKDVIYDEYKGTYADVNASILSKDYWWNHGLGEVITALTKSGLNVEFLHEHDASPYDILPKMEKTDTGQYVLGKSNRLHPLLYSLRARKKA